MAVRRPPLSGVARPSCRKKMRWPAPQSGAVRNSSGPAEPWLTLSASPDPMWCTSMSEKRFAFWKLSAEFRDDAVVASAGVWHMSQCTLLNWALPLAMDEGGGLPGIPLDDGVGGSRNRIK